MIDSTTKTFERRLPQRVAKIVFTFMAGYSIIQAVEYAQKVLALGKGECQCTEAAEEAAEEETVMPDETPLADS
jgi:hypothetical protein